MSYNMSSESGLILTQFYGDSITQPVALAEMYQGIFDQNTLSLNDTLGAGFAMALYTLGVHTNIKLLAGSGLQIKHLADETGLLLAQTGDYSFWVAILTPDESAPLPYFSGNGNLPICTFDIPNSGTNNSWASIAEDHTTVHLVPGSYRFEWSLGWV